ncbi:MAG: hypothetical protein ACJ75B_21275 [Flavisolibacter sp.]
MKSRQEFRQQWRAGRMTAIIACANSGHGLWLQINATWGHVTLKPFHHENNPGSS